MTTYQEPPLQSRRAARQVERASVYGQRPETPEPLTYATQNRPPLPSYDVESQNAGSEPSTQLLPRQDIPSYRPRDFSPEGRRANRAAEPEPLDDGRVEYRTQNRAWIPVVAAAPVDALPTEASVIGASVIGAPITEHTMTRRELRALREARGADLTLAEATAEVALVSPVSGPVPVAEPPAARAAAQTSIPVVDAPGAASELSPFEALFLPPSQAWPADAEPVALVEPDAATAFVVAAPAPAPEPSAPAAEPIPSAAAEVAAPEVLITEAPAAEVPAAEAPAAEVVAPAHLGHLAGAVPAGHWTLQSDLDDATQLNETTISRRVGAGGAITTSALVLPSIPSADYVQLGTGEVLVTGSIDLPHSLATSGAHPSQLDDRHLDHELDPGDQQVVSTDSQPVRAIRAVSTHTSTRNVMATKGSSGNRGLTALIISAAAMAAVVVTLLVVGLVSGVL